MVARPSRRAVLLTAGTLGLGGTVTAGALLRRGVGPSASSDPRTITLATGPSGAVFVEVGRDIAAAVSARHPRLTVQTRQTGASVENLKLLIAAEVDLGFATLDVVADNPSTTLVSGNDGVRALCRLYDSLLQLVVLRDSPITKLADCAGKRLGIGAVGSGTEFTVVRLLDAANIPPARLVRLGQSDAMAALERGEIDAAFSLTGFPTPAISELAQRRAVRLVPLLDAVTLLDRIRPGVYAATQLPAGTYPEVKATPTVYLPNLLLSRPGITDDVVRDVVDAVLSPASRVYWTSPDSRRIDVRTAIATGSVPLHHAALAWLREHKP